MISKFNLGMAHQLTWLANQHEAQLRFVSENPWDWGLGEYDYRVRTVVINLQGNEKFSQLAQTFCHELGHHLHHRRSNTIFPKNYLKAPFRIKWLMEIVADNIGTKLFRKYFRHLGRYERVSNPRSRLSRGYKKAKKEEYPYYFTRRRRDVDK